MKIFVKIFLLIVVMLIVASVVFATPAAAFKNGSDTARVTVTPTLYKDLLIVKANKEYRGAAIEVHDSTGAVVASSHIFKKKTIIDFYDIPSGNYRICVVKSNRTIQFNYTKKQDSEM